MLVAITDTSHPRFLQKGTIINIDKKLGTVRVKFSDGKKEWFSKRYLGKVEGDDLILGYLGEFVVEKGENKK